MTFIFYIGAASYCQKGDSHGTRIITLADPTIFYYNKTYYLYGTGSGGASNTGSGFVVYTSPDQKTWDGPAGSNNGLVLKRGDAFGTMGWSGRFKQRTSP